MAIIPIYNCFHPVLKRKTAEVTEFDQELKDLAENMFETMYNTGNGVGLAANQVGVEKSLFVINVKRNKEDKIGDPIIFINPVITAFSEEEIEIEEGCLSIPEYWEKVVRPEGVEIEYTDLDMKLHKIEADEFLARVIQHEFDHLKGILFYERISPLKRAMAKSKLRKVQKGEIIPSYPMIQPDGSLTEGEPEDEN